MTKIAAAIITIFAFFLNVFAPAVSVADLTDTSEFTPVIRFLAASDSHIQYIGDKESKRLQKAINLSYAIAESDKEYKKLDAIVLAGDLTDNGRSDQFYGFASTIKSAMKDGTQLVNLIGTSHDKSTMGKKALKYLDDLMGFESDAHRVINGFHFITISTSSNEDESYNAQQLEWLDKEIAKACAADPSKPVFVAHHEHNAGTVYGSSSFEGWGIDAFSSVLKKYPQVVDFSGHSHYPLNDPRSIWQGDYTAIGTGALYYMELTVDQDRTVHPDGYKDESQFWIVEVDSNNNIRLRGVDLIEQKWLCEYIINSPADSENRQFTPEQQAARSKAPVFANGAKLTVEKGADSMTVSFPAAISTDGMPIFLYRAYVYNENNEQIEMKYLVPKYYSATKDASHTIKLDSKEGTVKVVAETAYGIQSAPLTVG